MLKLRLLPDQNGYQIKEGQDVIAISLDGGAARYRRDFLQATSDVEVVFTVGPVEYQYLRAFYNTVNKGADAFLIDLVLETAELREYVAHFKPGTWKLSQVRGHSYQVKVTLEVDANDDGLDYAAIVANFEPEDWSPPPPPADFGGEEDPP